MPPGTLARYGKPEIFNTDQGGVSQGLEPDGYNLTGFAGVPSSFPYGSESATNYEIGYKGRLMDGSLLFTLAGFYIDYNGRQFALLTDDSAGPGVIEAIINFGDTTQWGSESELQWQLTRNWAVSGGIGYFDAEWDDGSLSPVNNADLSGRRPIETPEWGGTGAINYDNRISTDATIFGRVEVKYKDAINTRSQFFDVPGGRFSGVE